ncbi:MAG TPA: hypothetical protein PKB10_15200 [Tepidisphaeraceae bacterium]|nr:hypothetical protein [Tepidisphaeraceae bacterium]
MTLLETLLASLLAAALIVALMRTASQLRIAERGVPVAWDVIERDVSNSQQRRFQNDTFTLSVTASLSRQTLSTLHEPAEVIYRVRPQMPYTLVRQQRRNSDDADDPGLILLIAPEVASFEASPAPLEDRPPVYDSVPDWAADGPQWVQVTIRLRDGRTLERRFRSW